MKQPGTVLGIVLCVLLGLSANASADHRLNITRNDVFKDQENERLELTLVATTDLSFEKAAKYFDPGYWGPCSESFEGSFVVAARQRQGGWDGTLRLHERTGVVFGHPIGEAVSDFTVQTFLEEQSYRIEYKILRNTYLKLFGIDISGGMTMNDGWVKIERKGEGIKLEIKKVLKIDLRSVKAEEVVYLTGAILPKVLAKMARDIVNCSL